jgi:hypothetical protein
VAASEFRHLLYGVAAYALAEPLHTNTVVVITEEAAANFAFGEAGQILLSFRELGAIGVLDPVTPAGGGRDHRGGEATAWLSPAPSRPTR